MRIIDDLTEAHSVLAHAFNGAKNAVVLTGAGLSTQSGIPDYRGPGGVWSKLTPITFQEFIASEDARLEDWRRRFDMAERLANAAPNAAHHAITNLTRNGPIRLVVTQNIDGLHRRAGLEGNELIEVHGSADHARCLSCDRRYEIDQARTKIERTGHSPRCDVCGGLIKAAVISFGQAMPEADMALAQEAVQQADLFIAAGTSLVVYPVAALPSLAKASGAKLVFLSLTPTDQDALADFVVRTPLSETLSPWKASN